MAVSLALAIDARMFAVEGVAGLLPGSGAFQADLRRGAVDMALMQIPHNVRGRASPKHLPPTILAGEAVCSGVNYDAFTAAKFMALIRQSSSL